MKSRSIINLIIEFIKKYILFGWFLNRRKYTKEEKLAMKDPMTISSAKELIKVSSIEKSPKMIGILEKSGEHFKKLKTYYSTEGFSKETENIMRRKLGMKELEEK